jgi:hypothetical protein
MSEVEGGVTVSTWRKEHVHMDSFRWQGSLVAMPTYKCSKVIDEFIGNCYSIEEFKKIYEHCLELV